MLFKVNPNKIGMVIGEQNIVFINRNEKHKRFPDIRVYQVYQRKRKNGFMSVDAVNRMHVNRMHVDLPKAR